MIDSIYLALSGLHSSESGLRVIANNTSNLNTPGFKQSRLMLTDLYSAGSAGTAEAGLGVGTPGTVLSFKQGSMQNTGNSLDLAIDGSGLFTIRDRNGNIRYTRDGQFKFDAEGVLVTANTEDQVLAYDETGALVTVNISALRMQPARATTNVVFNGTLSTGQNQNQLTLENVTAIDAAGATHTLTVVFNQDPNAQGTWNLVVRDGTTTLPTVGNNQLIFNNSQPQDGFQQVRFTLSGAAATPTEVILDFSQNVTCSAMGPSSTIAMATQDGYAAGALTATSFDAMGRLVLTYSNGQTERDHGPRLALARFNSTDAVRAVGDNQFEAIDQRAWVRGYAGDGGFGSIRSAVLEMSNVDLSSEFSDLVIMQRGYQASSQVVATANEMLAELFGMKGK
jgi:flagellar hook protein FlgE